MEWEKIFANDVAEKWLICNIYKQPIQLNIEKPNNPIKKWAENPNRHFPKKKYRWLRGTRKDDQRH